MKLTYLLPCRCGREMPVETAQAGQFVVCQCGAKLEVPTLQGLKQLNRVVTAVPEESPRSGRWGVPERLLLAGVLLIIVGGGLALWFFVNRPIRIETGDLSPAQAWHLWNNLNKGPEQSPPPIDNLYLAYRATYHRWLSVGLGIATAGLVIMGSSWFLRSKRPRADSGAKEDRRNRPS